VDVESLAQIRHIVTEAVQDMREEMAALRTELRSEITDTKRHMGLLTDEITDTKQQVNMLTEEITGTKQHMGVLTEGVRHEVQLVAEAVQLQSERMTDVRHEVEGQAQETRALFQLSYEQLQQRVRNLEQRVRINE